MSGEPRTRQMIGGAHVPARHGAICFASALRTVALGVHPVGFLAGAVGAAASDPSAVRRRDLANLPARVRV